MSQSSDIKLTPKQEKFCQCIVSGMSGKDSYYKAYDTSCNEQVAYNESSKLMLRDDIQERIKALRKPLEEIAQTTVLTEREKKRSIIWEGIERCRAKEDESGVARYMDILNKMDAEYININRNIDSTDKAIDSLDIDTLRKLSESPVSDE